MGYVNQICLKARMHKYASEACSLNSLSLQSCLGEKTLWRLGNVCCRWIPCSLIAPCGVGTRLRIMSSQCNMHSLCSLFFLSHRIWCKLQLKNTIAVTMVMQVYIIWMEISSRSRVNGVYLVRAGDGGVDDGIPVRTSTPTHARIRLQQEAQC